MSCLPKVDWATTSMRIGLHVGLHSAVAFSSLAWRTVWKEVPYSELRSWSRILCSQPPDQKSCMPTQQWLLSLLSWSSFRQTRVYLPSKTASPTSGLYPPNYTVWWQLAQSCYQRNGQESKTAFTRRSVCGLQTVYAMHIDRHVTTQIHCLQTGRKYLYDVDVMYWHHIATRWQLQASRPKMNVAN